MEEGGGADCQGHSHWVQMSQQPHGRQILQGARRRRLAFEGFQYPFINGSTDLLGGHIPGWEIDVMRREEGSCASYISKTGQGGHTVELLGLIKASVRTFPSPHEDNFGIPRFEAVGLTGAVEIELDPIGDGTAKRSPLDSILIPGDELRASLID